MNIPDSLPINRCIGDFLRSVEKAQSSPSIMAVDRKPLSYGKLCKHIDHVVSLLNNHGLGRNDPIVVVLPNGPELAVALLSVIAGATCAPLNPAYQEKEYDFYISDLNARALIVQSGIDSPARAVAKRKKIPIIELVPLPEEEAGLFELDITGEILSHTIKRWYAGPEDTALVVHTSGTTSQPKIIYWSQEKLFSSTHTVSHSFELEHTDRCLNVMPLFHLHGLISCLLASLNRGGSVICTSGFDQGLFFDWVGKYQPTWYSGVSSIHNAVLELAEKYPLKAKSARLRFIRHSSSPIAPRIMQKLEEMFNAPVIEVYGMTEITPIAINPLNKSIRKPGSTGITVGPDIAIMDEDGNILPSGEKGEIALCGDNVIKSYGSLEEDEKKFINGWFRTGDGGYLDADGYLYITDRLSEIINRGGQKVSPREVDDALLEHPAVKHAVAFSIPHKRLGEAVAAAVVVEKERIISENELRTFLADRLAPYKIPQQIVFVDNIPKGSIGKFQRSALTEKLSYLLKKKYVPPSTDTEIIIAEIWQEVLGLDRIGVHDNFFTLGGDSILATQIISGINHTFNLTLPLIRIFETPTVEGLAEALLQSKNGFDSPSVSAIAVPEEDKTDALPLSFSQQRLWFLDQLEPGSSAYNISRTIRLNGHLNVAALERSIGEILRRHEVLRTSFVSENDQPVQRISPAAVFSLQRADLSAIPEEQREAKAQKLASEVASRPFDLASGPLLRGTLVQLKTDEYMLLITVHHIVSDGWSMGIFYHELSKLYEAFSKGDPSPLPELPIQYADFSVWQRQWLQGKKLEEQLAFWKEYLRDIATLDLPTDYQRPSVQSFRGAGHEIQFTEELMRAIHELSNKAGVTLFMTLLAAFQSLLHRYTGQNDIVVGTPIANRNYAEIEGLIGFFVNTLVIRADMSEDPVFREFLKTTRKATLDAYAHQELPFEKLVEELQPERDLSRNPLFQVLFVMQNIPYSTLDLSGVISRRMESENRSSKFDLEVYLRETEGRLTCTFLYNTDLFNAVTIGRMAYHYQTLLESIIENPDQKLSDLPLLTSAEQKQVLFEWNDTETDYPKDLCVNQLFEEQAEKTPDAIAVIFEDEHLSYRDLNNRSNRLARYLRTKGVGPEVLVGIYMERSLEMVIGLLGIIKAGGVYIPLDPSYPMQRITYMLEDSEAVLLLTQERLIEKLPASGMQIVRVDSDWNEIECEEPDNLTPSACPQDLSYVIYTSGSTGKPKGVAIPHGALVNFLWSMKQEPGLTGKDVLLSVTTLSFDIAALELFLPLIVGAQIVLVSRETAMDARQLIEQLEGRGVTVMQATPATWRMLLQADWKGSPKLKILIGGEALPYELANDLLPRCAELWNMYGPTETTIWSTVWKVESDRDRILIGRPIANTQVYILHRNMQPVPFGVAGELFIGGDGLAREYLKRPELTSEKFIVNPIRNFSNNGDNPSNRIYRTGDLARWLPDGQIECLGRIDHQVKIRGFRIELGEIESVLSEDPGVAQCVVVAREDIPGNKRLVAYIIAHHETPVIDALRQQLKNELADYMIPSAFVIMDRFPLTPNGKVDRKALPAPETEQRDLSNTFVKPRTPTEEIIAGVWCEVLGLNKVGINDNFFELGGHSLLTVQIQSKLQKALRKNIRIMDIFNYPTVAEMADCLIREDVGEKNTFPQFYTLLPVQSKGTKPPLFFLHLAQMRHFLPGYLGDDQPLYALMAQGLDGMEARYKTTRELSEHYIKEIRAIQPSGPYFLAGYCWGGKFAYDIAQHMLRQGDDVALLFLVEPALSSRPELATGNSSKLSDNGSGRHLDALVRLPLTKKISYVTERLASRGIGGIRKLFIQGVRKACFITGRPLPQSFRLDYIFDVVAQASLDFTQNTYPKDVIIVNAERGNHQGADWSDLAEGEVTVHQLEDVDHIKMVEEKYIDIWGKWLSKHLRKVQSTNSEVKRHEAETGAYR